MRFLQNVAAVIVGLLATHCSNPNTICPSATTNSSTTSSASQTTSTTSTSSQTTSSSPSTVLEIATCATFPVNPAFITGGDLFCLTLTVYDAVELRSLSVDIQGGSLTHDLLVGSAGTVYFHDLTVEEVLPDSSRAVRMGPTELPALPASSRDSGVFPFTGTFTLDPGVHALRITGMHDRPEDAPNEFMSGTAHYYFAWVNDGVTPFNDGDVRNATTGDPIPIDRIAWASDELLSPPYVMDPNLD